MNTQATIPTKNLGQEAPRSPRERLAGFIIAARTAEKCKAEVSGQTGEYHYNCPLDNMLFSFKGIDAAQFRAAVQEAKSFEELGAWLHGHGTPKTDEEIKAWGDGLEAFLPVTDPGRREWFTKTCQDLGVDPQTTTMFDMLEADDRATFQAEA